MKLLLITFFSIFFSFSVIGQENSLDKLLVGFACGESGKPTQLVEKMSKLIKDKKYNEIESFLNSKNSGEIYLAIIIIERLVVKDLYTLNERQETLISRLKTSPIPVRNCLGCFTDTHTMIEMFEEDNFIGENNWLDKILPIE
tara:strand:- start:5633 stop:6061 length:429 start_codon:yes stop_codon:yes gene_type:complete